MRSEDATSGLVKHAKNGYFITQIGPLVILAILAPLRAWHPAALAPKQKQTSRTHGSARETILYRRVRREECRETHMAGRATSLARQLQ